MRHLQLTAEMAARIEQLIPGVNLADITVFEAIALNTLPIRQRHPLYEDAINEPSVLHGMSTQLAKEQVPLYSFHDQYQLPHGYVFHGEVMDNELRVQFAVDNTEDDILRKMQAGTISQVSVGILTEEALCSDCGWDYFGEGATLDNIFAGVCGNGHALREDGVHVQLRGLDKWYELSLVDIGGAQGAHVVPPGSAKLGILNQNKLLLQNEGSVKLPLVATIRPEVAKEKVDMDTKELLDRLAAKIEENAVLSADNKVLKVEKDAASTDLKAALDRIETLEAEIRVLKENPDEKVEKLSGELASANDSLKAHEGNTKAIHALIEKLSVMAGDSEFSVEDMSVEDISAKFDHYTENLKKIVLGGATAPADTNKEPDRPAAVSAFRVKR